MVSRKLRLCKVIEYSVRYELLCVSGLITNVRLLFMKDWCNYSLWHSNKNKFIYRIGDLTSSGSNSSCWDCVMPSLFPFLSATSLSVQYLVSACASSHLSLLPSSQALLQSGADLQNDVQWCSEINIDKKEGNLAGLRKSVSEKMIPIIVRKQGLRNSRIVRSGPRDFLDRYGARTNAKPQSRITKRIIKW